MANTLKFGNGNWATKEGSILAYNDENNNFKPLHFDFARASPTTVVNKEGLIEVVNPEIAKIDYSEDSKGFLLLEPQRTNLLTQSEDISNSFWVKDSGTSITGGFLSPDGTLNAYSFSNTTAGNGIYSFNKWTTTEQTISLFAKKGSTDQINIKNGSNGSSCIIELTNGTVVSSSASMEAVIQEVGNGWYKCSITHTAASNQTLRIAPVDTGTHSIYIAAVQMEAGSFSTSYIKTEGTTVTRLVDKMECNSLKDYVSSSEGVIFIEASTFEESATYNSYITLRRDGDASFSNSITFQYRDNGTFRVYVNGTATANIMYIIPTPIMNQAENNKIAFKYKQDDYKLYINGVEQTKYLTPDEDVFTGLDSIAFDLNGYLPFKGKVKQVKYFNTALTDEELAELTS